MIERTTGAGNASLAGRPIEPANWNNFRDAANAWREDAAQRPGNASFFYFAGHGVQRYNGDHVLLCTEFGSEPVLGAAVDLKQLIGGMRPSEARDKIARTQFYFIDACRINPKTFKNYDREGMGLPPIWDLVNLLGDDRRKLVVQTTQGHAAYMIPKQQTAFSRALIECLEGGAGLAHPESFDANWEPRWCVTSDRLSTCLGYYLEKINSEYGIKQATEVSIDCGRVVIRWLTRRPEVEVMLQITPAPAHQFAKLDVFDGSDSLYRQYTQALTPHPKTDRFPAGHYTIAAKVQPPTAPYRDLRRIYTATPPNAHWPIPLE